MNTLRVNNRPDLVVLFNGGVKSAQTNQASRGLNLKWLEACQFAKRIGEAIRDKEIIVDHKERKIYLPMEKIKSFCKILNYEK